MNGRTAIVNISVLGLVFVLGAAHLFAQSDPQVISRRPFVTVMPIYQHWSLDGGAKFSEFTLAFNAYAPIGSNFGASIRGVHAYASGDVTGINDLSDTQVGLSYLLEKANLVVNCGINMPTGRRELTSSEFTTTLLLSDPVFDMRVPSFGQGWNINPGVTWAVRFSDKVVAGIGGSYHYKGVFKPLSDFGDFDPGDEILLTSGLDLRVSESVAVSSDLIFTTYRPDQLDGRDVFGASSKWVANAQCRIFVGRDELTLFVRYRAKGKSDVGPIGALATEADKTTPDQVSVLAEYLARVSDRLALRCAVTGDLYETTAARSSGVRLVGVALRPEYAVSSNFSIPAFVQVRFGSQKDNSSFVGVEAGMGVSVSF